MLIYESISTHERRDKLISIRVEFNHTRQILESNSMNIAYSSWDWVSVNRLNSITVIVSTRWRNGRLVNPSEKLNVLRNIDINVFTITYL